MKSRRRTKKRQTRRRGGNPPFKTLSDSGINILGKFRGDYTIPNKM